MMQSYEGKVRKGTKFSTTTKEAAIAVMLFIAGGSALAWGVGQMARPASAPEKPDDQCRGLANAFLAGDTDLVFSHLHPQDASHLKMNLHLMKAFQEKMLSPRLSHPIAWRPRHNRVISCQGEEGVISLHLGDAQDKNRTILTLFTKLEAGSITYRYDDLLRVLSTLDKNSKLTRQQKQERVKDDAAAMAFAELPGFAQLHPGPEADAVWRKEVSRLEDAKAAWSLHPAKPSSSYMASPLID